MKYFPYQKLSATLMALLTSPAFAEDSSNAVGTTHQLETIVVTASGFEQNIKDAPASISVVTQDDIQKINASSIADLLTDVPGIDIHDGVGKTANLNIKMRGLGSAYTLILIDGRRQTTSSDVTPNGFSETFSAYLPPISQIERIEVIRGPASTLYGSDAMGGVINIITKKVTDEWHGNVTLSGNIMDNDEEADSWKTSFVLNGPILSNRLGIQLRGSFLDRQESDRIPGSTGRDPRPSEADIYDIGAKLVFKFDDKNSFWIDGFQSNQVYQNTDDRLGTMDTSTRARGYSTSGELEFNRDSFSAGHDGEYSFGNWNSYISQTTTETIGRTIPTDTFADSSLAGRDRKLKNTDLIIDSHVITPIANHKITLGAEYKDSTIADDIAGIGAEFDSDSWSAYAEDEWSIRDNLALTLGGRYEHHSGFGGHFSPRGYLVWNVNEQITLKGGVSTGYKAPSAKELHDGIISVSGQGATFSVGSPDLEPEESINYELSLNYNNLKNLDLTTTIFHTKITDRITSGPSILNCYSATDPNTAGCVSYGSHITQHSFSQSINQDEAEAEGLEVSLKYAIMPEWDIKTAYTFTETEITKGADKGNYLNNIPRHAFNTTSTWHINPQLDIWVQHEFKSSRVRYSSTPTAGTDEAIIAELTDNKLKGYNLYNLGATYLVNKNIRVNGAINNILDKDFTKYVNYIDSNNEAASAYEYLTLSSAISGTYIPGRNFWLSLSYDF